MQLQEDDDDREAPLLRKERPSHLLADDDFDFGHHDVGGTTEEEEDDAAAASRCGARHGLCALAFLGLVIDYMLRVARAAASCWPPSVLPFSLFASHVACFGIDLDLILEA